MVMAVTGVFIGGPANMISAAITTDLGRQEVLATNDRALSTVTGVIDGTGSLGAAVGQVLIPVIEKRWNNWRFVFYFFVLMVGQLPFFLIMKIIFLCALSNFQTFITCCCIFLLFVRECKLFVNKVKSRYLAHRQQRYDTMQ